jgi:8-oxo-dGTP pyrophosphatase MutT (NUDIX family)
MVAYARRSARVLLLDASDRVLLVRSAQVPGEPERGHAWFTPGGGVEPNEELAVAAARELREETGLAAAAGYRWWTLTELVETTETVYPNQLAALVADLIAGRMPTRPVELPWHH